tara:strand:+ start:39 stop:395 length:357 start_codon:yes stop_codon:yes gene_type:complete
MSKEDKIKKLEKSIKIFHHHFLKNGKVPFRKNLSKKELNVLDELNLNPLVVRDCFASGRDSSPSAFVDKSKSVESYCQEKKKTLFTIPKKSAKSVKKKSQKKSTSKSTKRKGKKTKNI